MFFSEVNRLPIQFARSAVMNRVQSLQYYGSVIFPLFQLSIINSFHAI